MISRFEDGHYAMPENLGAAINTKYLEHDPFIAPDESYILFTSVDRPGGSGLRRPVYQLSKERWHLDRG